MLITRAQRLRDVERWQEAGWLTPAGASGLRAEIEASRSGIGLAHVLATLAAVLIGFAAMSFVAANWQEMSKLTRLAAIFTALWGLFGLAGWLKASDHGYFADAAILAAIALYGAGIMLIAQMYHMDGHPPDAVLLWGLGALATGYLTRSNPALAAALVLFSMWSLMELFDDWLHTAHWWFLPAWIAVAAGFALTRWRPALHLLGISLAGWMTLQTYAYDYGRIRTAHLIIMVIGLAMMAVSILWGPAIDRWRRVSQTLLLYGFIIAYEGVFGAQFVADRAGDWTLLFGLLTLAAIVGALAWAWATDNRAALWVAYAAFTVEIFSLYLKKIGTLLGTSLFFLITGLLVAALSAVAFRLHTGSRAREESHR